MKKSIFKIKNYKSIKEATLEVDKITILIGPPASGKSNILEALSLIGYVHKLANEAQQYHSYIQNIPLLSTILRVSSFDELFFFGLKGEKIEISEVEEDTLRSIVISDVKTELMTKHDSNITYTEFPHIKGLLLFKHLIYWPKTTTVFSYTTRLYAFDRFNVIANIIDSKKQIDVPVEYLDELGRNLNNILYKKKSIIGLINEIFKEYEIRIEAKFLREGRLVVFDYDYEVSPNVLSDTFYRFLYYLTAIYSNYDYAGIHNLENRLVLLFEEPESHVYPYASRILAEHLAKTIDRLKFIITTHNPHLISAIWDKVREVITYYVLRDSRGATIIYRVNMDKLSEKLVDAYDLLVYKPKKLIEERILEKTS
ncbi:MAG: hypothetical protein B6U89_07155 [Desulfurococcales archaeon ex4484_58]|nr:MAG: hypothetical protein B6U89_07155 [Desulfurococcales archaeon ex4484_58]